MKKQILLAVLSLFCYTTTFGQQKDLAEKLISEGIVFHDKGDYEWAIKKYDEALQFDENNLFALAEKAMSLTSLQKYEESVQVCQTAMEKHKGEDLRMVYVTCGNAYDGKKNTCSFSIQQVFDFGTPK